MTPMEVDAILLLSDRPRQTTFRTEHVRRMGRGMPWIPYQIELMEYLKDIRYPTNKYPWSFYRACHTQKFFRWLWKNHPDLAAFYSEGGE